MNAVDRTQAPRRIAVGMSGGVDSAVAAWLLQREGWDVIGLTMRIWDGSASSPTGSGRSGCYGPGEVQDLERVRHLARRLGIPHVELSLAEDYRNVVLDHVRAEYRSGRTPNPCMLCNPHLKFGLLLERARSEGLAFDAFATGHYARVTTDPVSGQIRLWRGLDRSKDQSYFLARLSQQQLTSVLLPLGGLLKSQIIEIAQKAGFSDLLVHGESQDFMEGEGYTQLFDKTDSRPGPILDTAGRLLGQHRGLVHYTVGQREGLGVAASQRLYVKAIQPEQNTLVVGFREEVQSSSCLIHDVSWVSGSAPAEGEYTVRLRYRHEGASAQLAHLPDGRMRLTFDVPQFAVAPGQAAVVYAGEEVLGSGWINTDDA